MAVQTNSTPALTVHGAVGNVVLTMTPQQARQLAASIWAEDADQTDWLDALPDMLRAVAAAGNTSPAHCSNPDSKQQAHAALVANMARIRDQGFDSTSPYNDTMDRAQAVLASSSARFRHNRIDSSSAVTAPVLPDTEAGSAENAKALAATIQAAATARAEQTHSAAAAVARAAETAAVDAAQRHTAPEMQVANTAATIRTMDTDTADK